MPLYSPVQFYLEQREQEFDRIPEERKRRLEELAGHVRAAIANERPPRLTFVCTHNSRRSQIAQLWAQAAAVHYSIEGVETYSGGTEATAFHPHAVQALQHAGFRIERDSADHNPLYEARYSDTAPSIRAFSKLYDQAPNPPEEFCAVMTCSTADENCPVVPGASTRVAIPYDDPGESDGTRREKEAYDDCCRRISREMLYVFSRVRT